MSPTQPDVSKPISPNYEAPSSDVFRDFTLAVIESASEFGIICHGRRKVALEKYDKPLFVSNWSQDSEKYVTIRDSIFQAEENPNPVQEYSENINMLKCRGFLVDLINGHGCNCKQSRQHVNHDAVQPINPLRAYRSSEAIKEALWSTVLGAEKNIISKRDLQAIPQSPLAFSYVSRRKFRQRSASHT
jgi:hypothetical protein